MPRPKRCRRVCCDPKYAYFKPQVVPLDSLDHIDLALDELEALRLADALGMTQGDAAAQMDVSQPTFNRILSSARNKVANGLVNGAALRIERGVGTAARAKPESHHKPSRRRCEEEHP